MVRLIDIPSTSREQNRGRRPRTDQRVSKSRDRWSRPISGRRGTTITHTSPHDPPRYINGANTYQFVGNDPVGMVDSEGTKWTITRDGKARATVEGKKGDTINSPLQTKDNHGHLVRLAADEYKKWLEPIGNSALPASATAPLKCDEKFTIPNTILASRGDIDSIAGLAGGVLRRGQIGTWVWRDLAIGIRKFRMPGRSGWVGSPGV